MRRICLGILGAAGIARDFVNGVRGSEAVCVAAVASRSNETARAFAEATGIGRWFGDYGSLLADPAIDSVYIPLPNSLHADWAIRAVRAGKHVLCEKPLAMTAGEARSMFQAARTAGVHLVEAFPYRSQPQTLAVLDLVRSGAIGRVRLIQAGFGFRLENPRNIRFDAALGGGAVRDAGSYPISLVRAVAGTLPRRVTARAQWTGTGVDLSLSATFEFEDGLFAQIACGFDTALHRHATIAGDGGLIETPYLNHPPLDGPATFRLKRGTGFAEPTEVVETEAMNGFRAEADSFARMISDGPGAWNGITPAESVDVATLIEACLASARTGKPVDIESSPLEVG